MTHYTMIEEMINKSDNETKKRALLQLIEWADSDEGSDFLAGEAHGGKEAPWTAEAVLELVDFYSPSTCHKVREDMG